MGRPSDYEQETADLICEQLVEGKSLRSLCRDEDMPSVSTVCRWLASNPEFREQYARAREMQADALFDEILDISDDCSDDLVEDDEGDKNVVRGNGVAVQRAKLRVDARKWMASKLQPKKYGDKLTTEHSGVDGKPIETVQRIERVVIDPANTDTA